MSTSKNKKWEHSLTVSVPYKSDIENLDAILADNKYDVMNAAVSTIIDIFSGDEKLSLEKEPRLSVKTQPIENNEYN